MTTPQDILTDSNGKETAKYTMAVAVMMTGVPAHRIRKFEECGLCKPARTASKQRLYSDNDIALIRKIAQLEKDGVNLAGVKMILSMQQPEKTRRPSQ
ncbi:MAG: MerR family transcriptional regulator [Dehalococcoidales bacterium]|nr:MerR family transcriptional regulator [Dehalococcoidales bacterium]